VAQVAAWRYILMTSFIQEPTMRHISLLPLLMVATGLAAQQAPEQ
jgi:hypothetical protein